MGKGTKSISHREAKQIVDGLQKVFPGARFLLLTFDDESGQVCCAGHGNPSELKAIFQSLADSITETQTKYD